MSTDKKRGGNFIMLKLIFWLLKIGIGGGVFYFTYFHYEGSFWMCLFLGLLAIFGSQVIGNTSKKWDKEEGRYVDDYHPSEFPVTNTIAFIGMIGIILGWIFDWI